MKLIITLAATCAAALALSACGAMGGSEFATKATAA